MASPRFTVAVSKKGKEKPSWQTIVLLNRFDFIMETPHMLRIYTMAEIDAHVEEVALYDICAYFYKYAIGLRVL
jgi:hypothetical protein